MQVCPCSYSVDEPVIEWLMESAQTPTLLIDTRRNPYSRFSAWRGAALRERYGKRYRYAGASLGNLNYQGGPIQIADPDVGIRGLLMYLREGYRLLLVCGCRWAERCHVGEIVKLLRQAAPEVDILYPDTIIRPGFVKCLSIRQCWAWIITHPEVLRICGIEPKMLENREWTTHYRGPILLHAGVKVDSDTQDTEYWIWKFGEERGEAFADVLAAHRHEMATKALVGIADLVDVVEASESAWYTDSYGFVLHNARPLSPIAYSGQQLLFDVPRCLLDATLSLGRVGE